MKDKLKKKCSIQVPQLKNFLKVSKEGKMIFQTQTLLIHSIISITCTSYKNLLMVSLTCHSKTNICQGLCGPEPRPVNPK